MNVKHSIFEVIEERRLRCLGRLNKTESDNCKYDRKVLRTENCGGPIFFMEDTYCIVESPQIHVYIFLCVEYQMFAYISAL